MKIFINFIVYSQPGHKFRKQIKDHKCTNNITSTYSTRFTIRKLKEKNGKDHFI